MDTLLSRIRHTGDSRLLGANRVFLGVLFLASGMMKYLVPVLREAWSGQLTQANIPLYTLSFWIVPAVKVTIGVFLIRGFFSRLAAVVVIGIMAVATYVHVVTDDPSLFPLQPEAPIIPLVVMLMAGYVVWRGGGAGSADLRSVGSPA